MKLKPKTAPGLLRCLLCGNPLHFGCLLRLLCGNPLHFGCPLSCLVCSNPLRFGCPLSCLLCCIPLRFGCLDCCGLLCSCLRNERARGERRDRQRFAGAAELQFCELPCRGTLSEVASAPEPVQLAAFTSRSLQNRGLRNRIWKPLDLFHWGGFEPRRLPLPVPPCPQAFSFREIALPRRVQGRLCRGPALLSSWRMSLGFRGQALSTPNKTTASKLHDKLHEKMLNIKALHSLLATWGDACFEYGIYLL